MPTRIPTTATLSHPAVDRVMIDRLLADASTTRHVIVEHDALTRSGEVIRDIFPDLTVAIVADDRTWRIAGESVARSLRTAGVTTVKPIVFPGTPPLRADYRHVIDLVEQLGKLRASVPDGSILPLAVGSGTINDLTKRAAAELGVSYAVVATAASMDGYTAAGAALILDGVKQTLASPAPELVIADIDIIARAPAAMTASGYGDLIGKITAGADWLLADALGIEPLIPDVWAMVQGPLPALIGSPERVAAGDPEAIEQIFLGLVMTGLAIQVAGSTRPASGSEHQFSHLWEMRGLEHNGEVVSHGFKVGLGAIVSAALYQELLSNLDRDGIDIDTALGRYPSPDAMEQTIRATHEHPMVIAKAREECLAKLVTPDVLRTRLTELTASWPELSTRLRQQLPPPESIRDLLKLAGAPTTPEEIGLTRDQLRGSYLAAQQIRRRYTVFDLVLELGVFDELVANLFAPDGYWNRHGTSEARR